jgi:hypothetical protein
MPELTETEAADLFRREPDRYLDPWVRDSGCSRERAEADDETYRDMSQQANEGAAARGPEDRSLEPEKPRQSQITKGESQWKSRRVSIR